MSVKLLNREGNRYIYCFRPVKIKVSQNCQFMIDVKRILPLAKQQRENFTFTDLIFKANDPMNSRTITKQKHAKKSFIKNKSD